ncbi:hypothetical protein [Rosenbergiella nectarea]|nr:hypothetical protein [Rosenbergiella nectarea]
MTDNNEAKRPVLSLKRKSVPKPAEAEKTPQKPLQAAGKSKKKMKKSAKHKQMLSPFLFS